MPKISVVITARNRARYLEECVAALKRQDYPADQYEIVIVDDASTDETPQFLESLGDGGAAVKKYRLETRGGPGKARNVGNFMAAGEIIAVQDSDDISLASRLRTIDTIMGSHPHADVFYSCANMVDKNLKYIQYHHARHHHWKNLERQQDIWHPTMAYRARILTCRGGPVEYPEDLADVDYGFLLKAKKSGLQYVLYDQPLALYRQHPRQISRAQRGLQQKLAAQKRRGA